ncbi:hypothetical protein ACJIZ3_012010 [Penstemon smallii]|uniref:Nuclear transcription factor Y subunit n=1 Tax=Penstemon smallii TaxID=265156 RepID=A0ABD3UQ45_9LAMI
MPSPMKVPSHLYDINHTRMPLPLEMAPEPVYVNAKQYHGILRRRQSRAKAELQKKLIKVRKPYLHESRHQHALRRERGSGGRFAKKSDNDAPNPKEKGSNSSGFKPLLSESNTVPEACNMYRNQTNFEEQAHQSHIGKTGEGHVSSQQWGNVTSNRALAMQ